MKGEAPAQPAASAPEKPAQPAQPAANEKAPQQDAKPASTGAAAAVTADATSSGKAMSLDEFQKAAMKLKILLENGIISQEEFDEEKKRLVANMQL